MRAICFFACVTMALLEATTGVRAQSAAQSTKFSGEWVRSAGLTEYSILRLKQTGKLISGEYEHEGHKCQQAVIKGTVKGQQAVVSMEDSDSGELDSAQTATATLHPSGNKLSWTTPAAPPGKQSPADSTEFVRKSPGTKNLRGMVDLALVDSGKFRGNETESPASKFPWFGVLEESNRSYVMNACTLRTSSNPVCTYVKPSNVIFMVRGSKNFSAGPITYGRMVNKRPTRSTPVVIEADRTYTFKLQKVGGETNEVLTDGRNEQIIVEFLEDETKAPEVVWVGDLDRDGKLDFLINAGESAGWMYPPSTTILLLSSAVAEIAGTTGIWTEE